VAEEFDLSKHPNILVPRFDTFGDIVLLQGFIQALLDLLPDARLTLYVREGYDQLAEMFPDRLIWRTTSIDPYSQPPTPDAVTVFMKDLKTHSYDLLLTTTYNYTWLDDLLAAALSDVRSIALGAPRDIPEDLLTILKASGVESSPRPYDMFVDVEETSHETEKYESLWEKVTSRQNPLPDPALVVSTELTERARHVIMGMGLNEEGYFLCFPAGVATVSVKTWSAESFAKVIVHLEKEHGLKALVAGHESEEGIVQNVIDRADQLGAHPRKWLGKTGDLSLACALIELSAFYLGNDTGLMHMAAALKKPVLALFGGGHWPRFLPCSDIGLAFTQNLPCFYCEWTACAFGDAPCIKMVKENTVLKGISAYLAGRLEGFKLDEGHPMDSFSRNLLKKASDHFARLSSEVHEQLSQKNQQLTQKEQQLSQKDQQLAQKDQQLTQKEQQLSQKDQQLAQKDQQLTQKDQQLNKRDEQIKKIQSQLQAWHDSKTFKILRFIDSRRTVSFLRANNKKLLLQAYKEEKKAALRRSLSGVGKILYKPPAGKINFGNQLTVHYGTHRSGWGFAIHCLSTLNNPDGVFLDTFLERTFCWTPEEIKPHEEPWIGFIHNPPGVPKWFQYEQSNEAIFQSEAFKKSLPRCRGLFTLSAYHREALENQLNVPIVNLFHPTEFPGVTWSWEKFKANQQKKIVQIGWWLRKLHAIFLFPETSYKKVFLRKEDQDMDQLLRIELEHEYANNGFDERLYSTAETMSFLPNKEYDRLLSENVVFLHLYDSSANNAVIECMSRNTPVLVNPIPAVIEYLGPDYPLYFNSLEEAAEKVEDLDLVHEAHRYLANNPMRKRLKGKYFQNSFVNSPIYSNL
jgi:ADP-heptose:LPS heptosyltransferase